QLVIDLGADTLRTDLGVDLECEIQCRCAVRKGLEFSSGGEHEHLFTEQCSPEIVDKIQGRVVVLLKQLPNLGQPFFQVRFAGGAAFLVFPMRGIALLSNVIHSFTSNLNFDPLPVLRHYRRVQRLISVGFWGADPITQTVGVGRIKVGHDRIYLPTNRFLVFVWGVYHNADGEQVVYFFKGNILTTHLIPDGVNGLRAAGDLELQVELIKFLFDGLHELPHQLGPCGPGGIDLLGNVG